MGYRSFAYPDGVTTVDHVYTKIAGNNPPSSWSGVETCLRRDGAYLGTNTPHYFSELAKKAVLPLNAYVRWDFREDRPHGFYGGRYNNGTTIYDYSVNSVRSVDGALSSLTAISQVVAEMSKPINTEALLQAAFADLLPQLDALTLLAEAHKTVEMVVKARRNFKDLLLEALRGGKHTVKAASRAWLEWRYGWQNLERDIADAYDYFSYPIRDKIVEGRAGTSVSSIETSNNPYTGYYVSHDYETTLERDLSVRANVVAAWRGKTTNAITNPFITGWELIPFSWVADWFVSVGDALNYWVVLLNIEQGRHFQSLGYKFTELGTSTVTNVSAGTGTYATNPNAWGGAKSRTEYRLRVPTSLPSLVPQVRVHLTSKRILDAAALLGTRLL